MNKLIILWTTDNEITIKNMLFMYAKNAKIHHWFDEVKIVIWGASSHLLANNKSIQNELQDLLHAGVEAVACLACSENLGITQLIKDFGIELKYVGEDLSQLLKSDAKILTI